jgi:diguanylate cyclase (GGDEF)-like protein
LWLAISLALFAFGQRLADAIHRQEQLAATDSLTGLPNRRSLLTQALRLLNDPTQAERCGLLMIDVDHFKNFNDTYGHALGDEVLRLVATTLARECRDSDRVGRVGGEEFVALLPDTPTEGCLQVAEHLRRTVEALHLPQGQLTISIGLTVLHGPQDSLEHALARADDALYTAKSAGRNCVRMAKADF